MSSTKPGAKPGTKPVGRPGGKPGSRPQRQTWPLIAGIVAAVVAAAVVVAVVANGGGDDETATAEGVEQNRPVQVEGTALPEMAAEGADDPAVGLAAPSLTGQDFAGAEVAITPGDGTPKMIVFLAHWCPHCQKEVPVLRQWNGSGDVPENLEVFAVSSSVDENAPNYPPSAWLEEEGWPWPVLADSADQAAAKAYGLTGFPYFVVVDGEGTVQARASGELPIDTINEIVSTAIA